MPDQLRPFYDAARALYPLLPQWYEQTDTCITPEFNRLNEGGLPVFCVPPGYTLMADEGAHEAGHAYFSLLRRANPGRDFASEYWAFRGFPGTWGAALAGSALEIAANAQWQCDPRESWAEAFARSIVTTHSEKTLTFGMDKDPLVLRAWFQALNPASLPPAQKEPAMPTIEWVGPAAGGNYMAGRSGNPITRIVDHWVGAGALEQAIAHFKANPVPGKEASAHYIVGTTGRIVQVVKDDDTAYHAGDFGMNVLSIGIEHEATPLLAPTDALYEASAWLHRFLADKHAIALEVGVTVSRHRDIIPTQCPGTLDVERIVNAANEGEPMTDADFARIETLIVASEARVLAAVKDYNPLIQVGRRIVRTLRGGAVGGPYVRDPGTAYPDDTKPIT